VADRRVLMGIITGAHGVRGEVRVKSFTAEPKAIAGYGPLEDEGGARRFALAVRGAVKGVLIARLDGITDRNAAERLKGTRLYLPRAALPEPGEDEFYHLFELYAAESNCEYRSEAVRHLLEKHYRPQGRALRRCHARDFLKQLRNYCTYNDLPLEMRAEYIDTVSRSFNFFAGFGAVQ